MPFAANNASPGIIEEMRAFQKYKLDPAYETKLKPHQKFAYKGANGVKAFLEKTDKVRGLAVYFPDGTKRIYNTLYYNIRQYPDVILKQWPAYDKNKVFGLNPEKGYRLLKGTMPQNEFHIFSAPSDFTVKNSIVGPNKKYYLVEFSAKGKIELYVPGNITELFVDGRRIAVKNGIASFKSSGHTSLIAFEKDNAALTGVINKLNWMQDGRLPQKAPRRESLGLKIKRKGFFQHPGYDMTILGKLPVSGKLKIRGQVVVHNHAKNGLSGIVTINGKQVGKVDNPARPWIPREFEADISEFAGQYVMIRIFTQPLGKGGYNFGGWENFEIVEK